MTSPAGNQHDDWYLIANQDGLAIKLRGGVTLGEDQAGGLCLDARDQASRWLTLSVDQDHLLVSEQGSGVQLAQEGAWSADASGLVLARGTVLEFPNNDVYISQSLHRGVVNMRVTVRCDADAVGLPPAEPALPPPAPSAQRAPAERAPARVAAASPPLSDDPSVEARDDDVMTVPGIPEALRYQPAARPARRHTGRWVGVALVVLAAALSVLLYDRFAPGEPGQPPGASASAANDSAIPVALPGVDPARVNAGAGSDAGILDDRGTRLDTDETPSVVVTPIERPAPSADETPFAAASTEPFSPNADVTTAAAESAVDDEVELERLLGEAQFLISEGFLTWPEVNAMTVIGDALRLAPGDPRALALRDALVSDLLREAQAAYRDGFQDSAIDVLEQVVAFHPEFAPALAQLSQWQRARVTDG